MSQPPGSQTRLGFPALDPKQDYGHSFPSQSPEQHSWAPEQHSWREIQAGWCPGSSTWPAPPQLCRVRGCSPSTHHCSPSPKAHLVGVPPGPGSVRVGDRESDRSQGPPRSRQTPHIPYPPGFANTLTKARSSRAPGSLGAPFLSCEQLSCLSSPRSPALAETTLSPLRAFSHLSFLVLSCD